MPYTFDLPQIRTNNDVEGWHCRLNHKAKRASLNMYLLINLLHEESLLVDINLRLQDEGKICRI